MSLDGTYSGLQASIAAFLNRADLTAVIPDFIILAEAEMNRRIVSRRNITRSTVTINSEFVTAPTDIYKIAWLNWTDYPDLQLIYYTPDNFPLQSATLTGRPRWYTLQGSTAQFRFGPVPDQSYSASLTYWQRLAALSSSNWLLTDHPDIYLYGACKHAAPYLIDDPRIAIWGGLFEAALSSINQTDPAGEEYLRADDLARLQGRRAFNIVTGQ